jgi:hypothetical protein
MCLSRNARLVPGGVTHDFENRSAARAGMLNISYPGPFEQHMPAIVDWFVENPPREPSQGLGDPTLYARSSS